MFSSCLKEGVKKIQTSKMKSLFAEKGVYGGDSVDINSGDSDYVHM